MKHVLMFLCVLPFLSGSPAKEQITKESILSNGHKRTYYLFVPEKLDTSKPAPLIVTLHGSGRNGRILLDHWKGLAEKEGIILAGPDSTNSASWQTPHDGPDFLRDVVEAVKATYAINPRRVYLFGHSAGAVFGLYMSLFESEYFAATAVHAGALDTGRDPALIDYAKRKTPIAIFVGTNDAFFPLKDVRATRDLLNARGFSVELAEVPHHTHDYYSRASEINRSAWEFLKKQELAADPQYTQYEFKR
ncbi:MAG TPA: alpha/beta hydrolase-fold protein [Blastocatellia bacterium]|nr:alpha/beta hydrolase-fold protein [Blastocatellia bacterium]